MGDFNLLAAHFNKASYLWEVIMNRLTVLLSACALTLATACGGGGDTTATTTTTTATPSDTTATASAVDKYVGSWSGCFARGTGSGRETLTITKTGETTGSFTFSGSAYASADCSGASTGSETGSGTATFKGTKTIGADTVDKIDSLEASVVEKQVLLIKNGQLVSGVSAADGGSVDSEGYPNTLDTEPLTKQ